MSRIYAKLKKRDIISLPSDRGPTSLAGGGEEGGPAAVCVSDLLWTGRGGNWETGSSHGKSMEVPWEVHAGTSSNLWFGTGKIVEKNWHEKSFWMAQCLGFSGTMERPHCRHIATSITKVCEISSGGPQQIVLKTFNLHQR